MLDFSLETGGEGEGGDVSSLLPPAASAAASLFADKTVVAPRNER